MVSLPPPPARLDKPAAPPAPHAPTIPTHTNTAPVVTGDSQGTCALTPADQLQELHSIQSDFAQVQLDINRVVEEELRKAAVVIKDMMTPRDPRS